MDAEPPFAWMRDKPDTFRHHLENDTGSFFDYTRNKRLELGEQLLQLRRIYLDTKYWLYVRDVYLGRPQKPVHVEIVGELRRLLRAGNTVCPVSYSVFNELLYQSDSLTRIATAEMIDELSNGCTIQPMFEVFKHELFHFVRTTTMPSAELYAVPGMIWTKAAFILGDVYLSLEGSPLPEEVALAMRKATDDFFWAISLTEYMQAVPPDSRGMKAQAATLAVELTEGKFEHQSNDHTFKRLFLDELGGVLDALQKECGDLMVYLSRQHGISDTISESETLQAGRMLGNLIRTAFAHGKLTTEFPTISIPASLHAAVRMDPNRKYKKGDSEDFHHAALAAGYFDIFLTERSLCHLLHSKDINVPQNYGAVVLAEEDKVLAHLSQLDLPK